MTVSAIWSTACGALRPTTWARKESPSSFVRPSPTTTCGSEPNVRRQIYLIFKEGIHNLARHSGAAAAEVELDRDGDWLVLRVTDNGRGFDPQAASDGHGLVSIRHRAAALGARVEWQSAPGRGTTLRVTVRLDPARSLSVLRGRLAGRLR